MSIPSEITALVERLNQELAQIEREATEGLMLARITLEYFPENIILIEMFAFLNNVIFLIGIERERIPTIVATLAETDETTGEDIQAVGEDLAAKLGRLLETKIRVSRIKNRLENLQ
ncbi:MAG: restriction endonuclease subunit S [Microcystaceae cyanobacterium]